VHSDSGFERGFPDSAVGTRSLVGCVPATACRSFYRTVEMKLTELGIRVCGEPVVSEEMALIHSATAWGFKVNPTPFLLTPLRAEHP
jgi:hypothetical protein